MSEQESGQVSEQEKEAIKYLKKHIIPYNNINGNLEFLVNDVLLNLIEKQQKVIDLMAEMLVKLDNEFEDGDCFILREFSDIDRCLCWDKCTTCVKEYFYKKVEEEND